ncbi:cupin domain-containing protein [Microbacterium sp. CPCC 204701]|uniref:cupin domain-containing protein n=1 Tax=Microbacterium sp. CPCC 204701 TaxID=2493084 RepID=UPI000FDA1B34|nr:cupin domain-containing protein [Microbacterium sp. CPCC 204701]
MDVRNLKSKDPIVEHGGTCLSYFFYDKEELREQTMGSYLEFVAEFELKDGARLEPHYHDSDEFYYILRGSAVMWIEGERRVLEQGDLVHIPRNAVHSIWPSEEDGSFRALSFATSFMLEGRTGHIPVPERAAELDR